MMVARIVATAGLVFSLLTSCSSSHQLTDKNATSLLEEYAQHLNGTDLADGDLRSSLQEFSSLWIGRAVKRDVTAADIKGPSPAPEVLALMKAGFLTKETLSRTYQLPNDLSGKFTYSVLTMFGNRSEQFEGTISVHMMADPSDGRLSGSWEAEHEAKCGDSLNGTLREDGSLVLVFGERSSFCHLWESVTATTKTSGGEIVLRSNPNPDETLQDDWTLTLSGRPVQTVELRWFEYHWSPKAQQYLLSTGSDYRVGKMKTGDVFGLVLAGTDTAAEGQFRYSCEPNEFAKSIGRQPINGVGRIWFQKKPDGSWLVSRIAL
jgi:hypothetical protein